MLRSPVARPMTGSFGTPEYAAEELRAELYSVFMGMEIGIEPHNDEAAAYIGSWLKKLKENKNEIFKAAADAQRAVDWSLDVAGLTNDLVIDAGVIDLPEKVEPPNVEPIVQPSTIARPSKGRGVRP